MSETALDRTARALDLVPYLLEHQGISTRELADVFGVSEKQINEDLVLIHMCGLPGYTPLELIDMYYEDGYVTVSDPQSLNKPRKMNRSEMTSLLVSLDLMATLRSDEIASEIAILQEKLRTSLQVENPIVVIQDASASPFLKNLEDAISKSAPVRIIYLSGSKDERTERIILPLELYIDNKATYLSAWCQKSNADRTFRLDRIISCETVDLQNFTSTIKSSQNSFETGQIIIEIDSAARNFIEDNRAIISKIRERVGDQPLIVELSAIDSRWLIHTVLGYGGLIKVLEPAQISDEIADKAAAICASYQPK